MAKINENSFAWNEAIQKMSEEEINKPVASLIPSYRDLKEALKYAHRFASRNDSYDVDYVREIIDRLE